MCPSNRKIASQRPVGASLKGEQDKIKKYKELMMMSINERAVFVPFVVETLLRR